MEKKSISGRDPIDAGHDGLAHDGGSGGGRARRPHFDDAIDVNRSHVRSRGRKSNVRNRRWMLFVILEEEGFPMENDVTYFL